jgi:hypothetical protein
MAMDMSGFSAPIPGENYTSDTKNYPWHRPPQFVDLDAAIEYIGQKFLEEEDVTISALTMMEAGIPITQLSQMYMMHGIMEGKWTFDYAILLAGPTAHILYILAGSYGIKADLGIDKKERNITVSLLKEMADIKETIDPGNAERAAMDAVAAVAGPAADAPTDNPAEEAKETPAPTPAAPPSGMMGMQPASPAVAPGGQMPSPTAPEGAM